MKSAITASTHRPQPSMKMPVCPVGANADARAARVQRRAKLEHHRHLADVRVGPDGEHDGRVELAHASRADRKLRRRATHVVQRHAALPRQRRQRRIVADEHVEAIPDR